MLTDISLKFFSQNRIQNRSAMYLLSRSYETGLSAVLKVAREGCFCLAAHARH